MIYNIRQRTEYEYAAVVPFARHALRLAPLHGGLQSATAVALAVRPAPAQETQAVDFFGNRVTLVTLETPHDEFSVTLTALVRVEAPMPLMADLTPPWEAVRDQALAADDLGPASPVHFLFASRVVGMEAEIGAYAAASFPPGRPVLHGAQDLMRRIKRDFVYEPGATEVSTPPLESFRLRRGVCQDFAHVMIAGLRWLGLPAGYVSGYLCTAPPPGQPRLQGADAMHAWVRLWAGAEAGWCGLDPTNDCMAMEDHIAVAVGRDYADVAPIEGILYGSGEQALHNEVDVIPVG